MSLSPSEMVEKGVRVWLANTYGLGLGLEVCFVWLLMFMYMRTCNSGIEGQQGLGFEACSRWLLMFTHIQTEGMRDNETKRRTKGDSSEKG